MNEAHKKALKVMHGKLTDDLDIKYLDSTWTHTGLFNEDMMEEIYHEKTRKQKVQRMLQILLTRGPRAFDKFVRSLEDHYSWLAEELRKTYNKISHHIEPEMLSLKKKVDIYVHEKFGNSKRLCEDDKKEIRQFLYSHLKGHKEDEDPLYAVEQSRRNSLESNSSDIKHMNAISDKDIEVKLLLNRVYSMFGSDLDQSDSAGFDDVDGPADVTIDIIDKKVKDLNKKVDMLQNEINDCYTVLQIETTEQPLPEVLKDMQDNRIVDQKRLKRLRDNVNTLEQQRSELEEKIRNQQEELQETVNKLADAEHKIEKQEHLSQELKEERLKLQDEYAKLQARCDKLDNIHMQHMEKQQTLMELKCLMNKYPPQLKPSTEPEWLRSSTDKRHEPFQLPKLSPTRVNRQGRQSLAGPLQEQTYFHENTRQRTSHYGTPWK